MDMIKIECEGCGTEFERPRKEWNRSQKLGRKNYCTQSCATTTSNRLNPRLGDLANFKGKCRGVDEFSSFRSYLRSVRRRNVEKGKEFDVDLAYLKQVWSSQKGICPYTGIQMDINDKSQRPEQPSLDRIDSTKGYVKGNVEFVCLAINYAKNGFSKEVMQKFVDNIKNSANV